jgi:hypothetical protein
MARFKVKAKKYGTTTGATGNIIHTNPEGSDENAVHPIVDEADIPMLVDLGMIEDPGEKLKPAPEDQVIDTTVARIDEVAAEAVEDIAEVDNAQGDQISGLEHREAVHYDPAQGVGAAETGIETGDPDAAPPAPVDRTTNRTAAGTTKREGAKATGSKS